ncbi:MAG: S9 family peptidase [Gemmataceae bacterium]|nr:S9 family peptidase [Gemmataceae bacterium]
MPTLFSIDRFLNIRAATGPSFSPDGRFVTFLTNITGVAQLWQVPVTGGWPTQLTFTNESVRGAQYSPRKHELVFSMDTGGNERTQLYRLHGIGGGTDHGLGEGWLTEDLTRQPQAIHTLGDWSHDGERLVFSANRQDPSRFDIFVQKIHDANAQLLHQGPGGYYTPVGWSPDDRSVLVYRMESNFNQDLFVLDAASGRARHLTPHQGDAQYHSPSWSGDGKRVYCSSTAGGRDLTSLAQIDVASGQLSYLETPEHEVEGVRASPKGRWLAWLLNAGGRSELKLRDLKNGQTRTAPGLPLGVVSQLEFAQDDSKLALVFDGPRYNMDVWIWDLAANQLRQLTHSSRAGIPFTDFVEPQLIQYKTFDGRMIPAWFYRPAAQGDRLPPVIVYPHGGPESQTRPNFTALFQYFLQRGYAILAPNVRGSSGYGTTYMNLDNTTKRMDSVADLAHAAYWLRDQKQGDPKRLAVYGGSYGGFMVLAAVTHYPDLWAAGIDIVGICNFVTFMEKTGAYRRAHREAEYGNVRAHRNFFEKISPIHHVDKIKCPMLVIHGANDPRVPVEEAEQIVTALKKRGIPVEYLRYEDEGHGLARLKNRLDAYPKMANFLDKYLK